MAVNFKDKTLQEYLDQLSRREPVPGGGSAAALTAAMAVGLISMVTNYSIGRKANTRAVDKRLGKILAQSEPIRLRLLALTSLDSEAYLKVSAARSLDKKAQKQAAKEARAVPQEICKLCYKALQLTPYLAEKGNPYLISDVEVALELLLSAFNGAKSHGEDQFMSAQILDGKLLAAKLKERLTQEIHSLKSSVKEVPRIFSIVVGNDPASLSYAASQQKTAQTVGIHYELQHFKDDSTQDDVLKLIDELNSYDHVHGIIVNKPLPAHMNFSTIINAIAPYKDIEGMNLTNFGLLLMGEEGIFPCTPTAALELLKSSGVSLKGKHAVVIGRSEIVGKPVALLLLREDMTVTICHSKTIDLPFVVHDADVVIAALGKPGFVKGEWVKNGAIVIDVGINQVEGKIVGDVDFASAADKASYITPVPGGVGPVTAVMLMNNAVKAFKIQNQLES